MSLQSQIDAIDYPPTHQYDLETMQPKGMLQVRLDRMPNHFFLGRSFLDIGCNKGFFSLLAKQRHCNYVEGFDYDEKCVTLCKNLGLNVNKDTFRDYVPTKQFDRIMLGNVMHYMYRECGDWTFIIKLAAISNGLVLIEAPTGMDCKAMKPVFETKELRKGFNEKLFFEKMAQFFILKSKTESPSNNRWIMLFERKPVSCLDYNFDELKEIKSSVESRVYKSKDRIIKIQENHTVKDFIKTFIASYSPISNGVLEWIYHKGEYVGWSELKVNQKTLRHGTRQDEVFKQLIKHNIYLAKQGLTEMDMGISNFFEDLIMYDKGGVWFIKDLEKAGIEDIDKGYFFSMFKNSFKNYIVNYEKIHQALNTRDSNVIEVMYDELIVTEKKKSFFDLFRRTTVG